MLSTVKYLHPVMLTTVLCVFCANVRAGPQDTISTGNSIFTIDLAQSMHRRAADVGQFFSPISVGTVMGMLYVGSKGTTASSIARGMHFPDKNTLTSGYSSFITATKGYSKVSISLANRVFLDKKYHIEPDYMRITQDKFQSEASCQNFGNPNECAKVINDWVKQATNNKIASIVTPDNFGYATKMILTSAIYFKGAWDQPFDKDMTLRSKFYVDKTSPAMYMKLMQQKTNKVEYAIVPEIDAAILGLYYTGKTHKMVFILPNDGGSLSKTLSLLSTVGLDRTIRKLAPAAVPMYVKIPKWKVESTINMDEFLKDLKMADIFSPTSDLSGISASSSDLQVSRIVQKTFLEVSEEGAEAAAATAIVSGRSLIDRTPTFLANRPFFYAIIDTASSTVLFAGLFVKP